MRLADLDTTQRHRARVVAIHRLTAEASDEDVRELELALEAEVDDDTLAVRPGQCIAVIVPGPHPFGHGEHLRLYTVADIRAGEAREDGSPRIAICVRRCAYVDPYSGERYPGIASNYLCDRRPGDWIVVAGPYGLPFPVPESRNADLLLIGLGTGIAPFRAFVRHLHDDPEGWAGRITLFYGARTGLEMLYMNDQRDDFARYLDTPTFRAFRAHSPRPQWGEPAALGATLDAHREDVWRMLCDAHTHVYVAGLESIRDTLDESLGAMAGSPERWLRRKAELVAGGRWFELVY